MKRILDPLWYLQYRWHVWRAARNARNMILHTRILIDDLGMERDYACEAIDSRLGWKMMR